MRTLLLIALLSNATAAYAGDASDDPMALEIETDLAEEQAYQQNLALFAECRVRGMQDLRRAGLFPDKERDLTALIARASVAEGDVFSVALAFRYEGDATLHAVEWRCTYTREKAPMLLASQAGRWVDPLTARWYEGNRNPRRAADVMRCTESTVDSENCWRKF